MKKIMKILVTGGSGFLGSHVADELSKRGHQVTIFDKKKSKWITPGQKIHIGNILNYKDLDACIKNKNVIFHFAALADLDEALHKPIETVKNNILATVNILDIAKKYKIKRIIYASSIYSMSIHGGFYKCSKKAAEDYIEEYYKRYGLDFTILRYGSLYGLRTGSSNGVFNIIKSALDDKKIQYDGSSKAMRNYIHATDAAKATIDALSTKYKNKYVNIIGAKSYKVTELFKIVSQSLKISNKTKYLKTNNAGHYAKFPKLFKLRKGLNYKIRKSIKFKYGIESLIKNMKQSKTKKRT